MPSLRSARENTERGRCWLMDFQYDENLDSPSDIRSVLLIISTLIAAVTFQAGVNPPGGVWQESVGNNTAGHAIYASQKAAFYVFLISNTLALSTSILVIVSLTYRFPFQLEVWMATAFMLVTYASSIFAVTPHTSVRFRYVLIAAAVPLVLRTLIQVYKKIRPTRISRGCDSGVPQD